jgi:predicted Zn-dependent peptidase
MAKHGITAKELDWAKDNSIGTMELSLETASGIAAQLDEDAFYGLGLDYSLRYPSIIRGITKSNIDSAAAKYLKLSEMVTVVAGPAVPK